jgi:hypothetical protein
MLGLPAPAAVFLDLFPSFACVAVSLATRVVTSCAQHIHTHTHTHTYKHTNTTYRGRSSAARSILKVARDLPQKTSPRRTYRPP